MKKKLLLAMAAVLLVIQFFPAAKNISTASTGREITRLIHVPAEVESILKTSCYDCHSNNTRYPWYAKVQPVGWWLANHIREAKEELNFDEFAGYTAEKQKDKFEDMAETVSKKEMPLSSYTLIHRDAILTAEQTTLFVKWAESMQGGYTQTQDEIKSEKEESEGEQEQSE